MTIWKFPIVMGRTHLKMPPSAKVVHVGEQDGVICLWVLLDPEALHVQRAFHIYGTGREVEGSFVGTVIIGMFVWHVFEVIE